jgi:hypothetical protein
MGTYGTLIEGIRIRHIGPTVTVLIPVSELVLQLLIATSVTRLVHWPVFCICTFNFAILFNVALLIYFQPYEDKWSQNLAIFNKVTTLALNYHLFLFTNFVVQPMYVHIANSVIYVIWFNIGVNVLTTCFRTFMWSVERVRLHQKRQQHRENIATKREIKHTTLSSAKPNVESEKQPRHDLIKKQK